MCFEIKSLPTNCAGFSPECFLIRSFRPVDDAKYLLHAVQPDEKSNFVPVMQRHDIFACVFVAKLSNKDNKVIATWLFIKNAYC